MHTITDKKLLMLKPVEILLPKNAIRNDCYDYELGRLAASISVNGIIEPITVRKADNGKYVLVTGYRRLKAAVIAGMRRVPCILHRVDSDTAEMFSLCANIQRKDLTLFEKARVVDKLYSSDLRSRSEISAGLGVSTRYLEEMSAFLQFDSESEYKITSSGLPAKTVRLLLNLPKELRLCAIEKIINEDMNYKSACALVNGLLYSSSEEKPAEKQQEKPPEKPQEKPLPPMRKFAIGDIRLFTNSLQKFVMGLKTAGVGASLKRIENDKFTEYRIKIPKSNEAVAEQLKIC